MVEDIKAPFEGHRDSGNARQGDVTIIGLDIPEKFVKRPRDQRCSPWNIPTRVERAADAGVV